MRRIQFLTRPSGCWIGLFLIVPLGYIVTGCDSGGANASRTTIAGPWERTIETDSVTYDLTFELDAADDTLSANRVVGRGEFKAGPDVWEFDIPNGRFREPSLGLTLRFDVQFDGRDLPITIEGTVDDEYQEISAHIYGGPPQFDGRAISIVRP